MAAISRSRFQPARSAGAIQKVAVLLAAGFLMVMLLRSGVRFSLQNGWWNPRIACDAPAVDLGRIPPDQTVRCRFVLNNRGRRPLRIERIRIGCASCLKVVDSPQEPVPPAGSGVIVAEFLPTALRGPVVRTMAVHSNDPACPVFLLTLEADVQPHGPGSPEFQDAGEMPFRPAAESSAVMP